MLEHIKITRGEIIEHLTQSCIDDLEMDMNVGGEKVEHILKYGWKGLENQSDEELISDYQEYICPEFPDDITIELVEDV
jgi:hypothetical protein